MTIYYSICFSLGKPQENLYILMMMLQVRALKKTGMMQEGDVYVCVADEGTATEIQKQPRGMPLAQLLLLSPF